MSADDYPQKNSIAVRLSRDMLLGLGLVDPTPAEQAEQDRLNAEHQARKADARPRLTAAIHRLDTHTDPLARQILDLHQRTPGSHPTCQGCDYSGYEGEPPDWPCRTVGSLAGFYGIDLADIYLYDFAQELP